MQIAGILHHEISLIPPSLAKPNGNMNTLSRSDIVVVLTSDTDTPVSSQLPQTYQVPCILMDGYAMTQALWKPSNCQTVDRNIVH